MKYFLKNAQNKAVTLQTARPSEPGGTGDPHLLSETRISSPLFKSWHQSNSRVNNYLFEVCALIIIWTGLPIRMTWGIPQQHWIQKRGKTSAVQYSKSTLRGDNQVFLMIVKLWRSTFFLRFQRRFKIAHQICIRGSRMWNCAPETNVHSLYFVQHSPQFFTLKVTERFV